MVGLDGSIDWLALPRFLPGTIGMPNMLECARQDATTASLPNAQCYAAQSKDLKGGCRRNLHRPTHPRPGAWDGRPWQDCD
jgi:hypothetical protein